MERFAELSPEFLWARTPEELAARMKAPTGTSQIDARALTSTIAARDRRVLTGLGKDLQVMAATVARRYVVDRPIGVARPAALLDPHDGPLLPVRLSVLTRKTLGGLAMDLDGRVLDPEGTPVSGLAAGRDMITSTAG